MDEVLCNYSKSFNYIKNNYDVKYPQSHYGFFRNLEPMKDAIESANFLFQQDIFDVYILTAPSVHNPMCYTEKRVWVEEHLGMDFVQRLIISPNKGLNRGDYLIDDHDTGRGQEGFQGKFIHFGYGDFKDWKDVMKYFKEKYNL